MGAEGAQLIIKDNLSDLAQAGAEIFVSSAKEAVKNRGRFVAAISGGTTPRPMYTLFATAPYLSKIPWGETHIFWVDDRCVPVSDPASNYGLARSDFLDTVPIPNGHIHNIPVETSPEKGALEYEKDLKKFFDIKAGEYPVFDLISLGVGIDGHIASLFPGHNALKETMRMVLSVHGGEPPVDRVTMTLPALNSGRKIVLMASGKVKAKILRGVFSQGQEGLPAGMIEPVSGGLIWLIDREAASLL